MRGANRPANRSDYTVTMLLVGPVQVGKTQICEMACSNKPEKFTLEYGSTIGIDFKIKNQTISEGKKKISYTTWDSAGQERFRNLTIFYYKGEKVIALCLDLSGDPQKVQVEAEKFLQMITQHASENVPVCIIGTKADLAAQSDKAQNVATNREYLKTLTSEVTNLNIQGVFVTSAKEKDNPDYNQRIDDAEVNSNAPTINSLYTVMDSVRSVGLAQVKSSLNIEQGAVRKAQPRVAEPPRKLLSELDEKYVTAGVIRGIITDYSSTSIFGKDNRHSAMKNLDDLLLNKGDRDELKGSDIVNCLGSHGQFFSKQRKIEEHLTHGTTPTASTEDVYVKIYNQMMTPGGSR